ncbi:Ig-like domain-containing protein [Cellulomonas rhizosphaerae]|nr:Ig-like domain-containing protein [Cellulomonas rhizosphaerae]
MRRLLALTAALGTAVAGSVVVAPAAEADGSCTTRSCTVTYYYEGSEPQTWTVPAGVTSVDALLVGGDGLGGSGTTAGFGGVVEGTVPVTPGQELTLRVGAWAGDSSYGGGATAGGGGGTFLADPTKLLLVAGGGGSIGSNGQQGGNGGGGLSLDGAAGAGIGGGGGATATSAGTAGDASAEPGTGPATRTTFGTGGAPATATIGAGGGGYFGGGGGGADGVESFGGGGGSGYVGEGVRLVAPRTPPFADLRGLVVLTYAAPAAVTTTATIALGSDHAVAGRSTKAKVTITASSETDLTGGTVQLLVDGKKSGAPVAAAIDGATAAATLTVPATGVGVHQVSAAFSADDAGLASTTSKAAFTVLPATLPWTIVDAKGHAVTSPLSSPEVFARATGQLPGATVRAEVKIDGEWTVGFGEEDEDGEDIEGGEQAEVADDGTVEIPLVTPIFLALTSDDIAADHPIQVRLVAESPFGSAGDLTSTAKTVTVPGFTMPIDLQVDPGPYRSGDGVDNAVKVSISWFDEDLVTATVDDIVEMLDEGQLTLRVDGRAVDPQDIDADAADDETAVLTFAAPRTPGDHTVQAIIEATEPTIYSASKVRHFTVAPSTFDAALLDDDGNAVTTVHPGDTLHAAAAGLLPGTKVGFELHSTPTDLGSATADADGFAVADVTIPLGTPAGKHTLVVTATDALGDVHVQKVAVTVVVAADPDDELAVTGSNVQPMLLLGSLLLLVGAGLLVVARRRRA